MIVSVPVGLHQIVTLFLDFSELISEKDVRRAMYASGCRWMVSEVLNVKVFCGKCLVNVVDSAANEIARQ